MGQYGVLVRRNRRFHVSGSINGPLNMRTRDKSLTIAGFMKGKL